MDFHSLSRRQLQALCKKNKIPANLTNLAMADALKSLQLVEGIDECLQPSQSETTQSSIDLSVISEVTSPYVPPSASRSTRRRQVGQESETEIGAETLKSMSRARLGSRKYQVNDLPESQGGSLMDMPMTPAPLENTGRQKRAKEDSKVRRAYSTRRSVRLAEKHTKVLKEEDNDMASKAPKQLPGEIGFLNVDTCLKEVYEVGSSDEISGVLGVDTNSKEGYSVEVVSAQKQDVTIDEENKFESSAEEERSASFEMGIRDVTSERVAVDSERGIEWDEDNWEKAENSCCQNVRVLLNLNDDVEKCGKAEIEHCAQVHGPEQETKARSDEEAAIGFEAIEVGHHFEEIKARCGKEEGSGLEAETELEEGKSDKTEGPSGEEALVPINLNNKEEIGFGKLSDLGEERYDLAEEDVDEGTVESSNLFKAEGSVFEPEPELEEEKSDKTEDPIGEEALVPLNLNYKDEIGFGTVSELGSEERYDQIEDLVDEGTFESSTLIKEVQQCSGKDAMDRPSSGFGRGSEDTRDADLNTALMKLNLQQTTEKVASGNACKSELIDHSDILAETKKELGETGTYGHAGSSENGEQGKGQSPVDVDQLTREKYVPDNKENIVDGKLVPEKQKIRKVNTVGKKQENGSLDELSIRKLSKMLKEKLEITQKPRENDKHGSCYSSSEIMPRSALATLDED